MDDDLDLVGLAGERLVDRVVDDLVDQMVEPARTGGADVHAGTLADGLEALQDRDVLGAVGAVALLAGAALVGAAGLAARGRALLGGAVARLPRGLAALLAGAVALAAGAVARGVLTVLRLLRQAVPSVQAGSHAR
jgi:hypothetical protein